MMTPEFELAMRRVAHDARIDDGHGADLVAVGVQRADCLELLQELLGGEGKVTAELLAVIVQWAVATGVWLERERWQVPA